MIPIHNYIRSFMLVFVSGSAMSESVAEEFWLACGLQFIAGSLLLFVGMLAHLFVVNDISSGQLLACNGERFRRPPVELESIAPKFTDSDVEDEARRVESGKQAFSDAVLVRKLVKRYPGGHLAVCGVSFGIKKG